MKPQSPSAPSLTTDHYPLTTLPRQPCNPPPLRYTVPFLKSGHPPCPARKKAAGDCKNVSEVEIETHGSRQPPLLPPQRGGFPRPPRWPRHRRTRLLRPPKQGPGQAGRLQDRPLPLLARHGRNPVR